MATTVAKLIVLSFAISHLIVTVGLTVDPAALLRLGVDGLLSVDPYDVEKASLDFGKLSRAQPPLAVLHPASEEDIARLVKAAYKSAHGLTVSARGHGHSINGQAQASNGVVIEMTGYSVVVNFQEEPVLVFVSILKKMSMVSHELFS
ncbi:cytokinin dehydrogenase 5 [Tripterygium wilfordii]|uniref:Cytokinin dehydrogenase 5 n=1 Tax=Tripterygium wilfordii TaxID=458696 RepID=A0A7J7D395_TRIWF|nr:cytokinin dehydrogenase 5 [Tripterygium wilfordii]